MMPTGTESSLLTEQWFASAVREELRRLECSRNFPGSRRLRALLTHLVECVLAGDQRALNQRELAAAVFGRGDDFDPERDAIVRVEMAKLRKALDRYYASDSDTHAYRITIPKGRYVPVFEAIDAPPSSRPRTFSPTDAVQQRGQTLRVRPFECLSDTPGAQTMADSLTDELQVTLARLPYLRVLPHQDSQVGAGSLQGFLLQGTVKRERQRLRVNASLQRVEGGEMLWAERFDRVCPQGDALDVQDEIVMTILTRTADVYSGTINQSLMETLTAATRVTFTSEEATLLFYRYLNRHCNQSYQDARRALELATPRDPENAILIALLADIRRAGYSLGFSDAEYRLSDSMELARRAVALAPESPTCRLSLGYALLQARDRTELLRVLEPLLADQHLSPCYRGDAAVAVALSGEWQRARVVLDEVLAYMPTAPHSFTYPIFLDAYRSGDYVQAQRIADRFRPSPLFWQPMLRAAVLGQLGEVSRAQSQLTGLLQSRPHFAELGRRWLSCFIMEDSLVDAILDGLDKAGLEVTAVGQ